MFKPVSVGEFTFTDQLLLRRIMDGSVSIFSAKIIAQKLIEGVYKDADEAIDQMSLLQLSNNRKGFEALDELYQEKDADLMDMIKTPGAVHGVPSTLFSKVLRRSKGHAAPFAVGSYIEVLKEQHGRNSLG